MRLLELGAVPVLNENDSVSIRELVEYRRAQGAATGAPAFGDNDGLSARVAVGVDADLLVLLTNVDGLFTANPRTDPDARRIDAARRGGAGARRGGSPVAPAGCRASSRRRGSPAGAESGGHRRGRGAARARAAPRRRGRGDAGAARRAPCRASSAHRRRRARRGAGGQRRGADRARGTAGRRCCPSAWSPSRASSARATWSRSATARAACTGGAWSTTMPRLPGARRPAQRRHRGRARLARLRRAHHPRQPGDGVMSAVLETGAAGGRGRRDAGARLGRRALGGRSRRSRRRWSSPGVRARVLEANARDLAAAEWARPGAGEAAGPRRREARDAGRWRSAAGRDGRSARDGDRPPRARRGAGPGASPLSAGRPRRGLRVAPRRAGADRLAGAPLAATPSCSRAGARRAERTAR